MKRFAFAFALGAMLALSLATPAYAQDTWLTTGLLSGPLTAGQVLFDGTPSDDTGTIAVNFDLMVTSTVTAALILQKIDADGTTVVKSQAIIASIGTQFDKDLQVRLSTGQKYRIVLALPITTGFLWASVFLK